MAGTFYTVDDFFKDRKDELGLTGRAIEDAMNYPGCANLENFFHYVGGIPEKHFDEFAGALRLRPEVAAQHIIVSKGAKKLRARFPFVQVQVSVQEALTPDKRNYSDEGLIMKVSECRRTGKSYGQRQAEIFLTTLPTVMDRWKQYRGGADVL